MDTKERPLERPTVRLVTMVPPKLAAQVELMARRDDRSVSSLLRRAATLYVEEGADE
jgi:hypothetical protein